ncbi:hypothetical protein [Azospirillum argentinense]
MIAQQNSTSTDTEEGEARADALAWQWISILDVILAAPPVSMADGVAIADLLMDSTIGLPISGVHGAKLTAFASLRDLMARQAAQDAADAELLSLFRQWVENESLFDGNPLSDEDASVASDNGKRLMLEIAAIPAHTAIGFSIKIYAREHWLHGSPAGQPATAVRMPDLPPEAVEAVFQRNMFRDALRVMPELNALMGDAALPAEVADV